MTMRSPPCAALAPAEPSVYEQGYERLRRHAVEPGARHDRHGLAVVALRGLAAWLHAFAELPAPTIAVRAGASPGPLPTAVETSAIDVLIAMLRGHMGREAA